MTEEGFSPDMGFESWWSGEWGSEISPEDLVRVQENVANAKKAAWQTFKNQKANKQYALMLSFIFKYIDEEQHLWYVYELMTKYQIETTCIFAHFLPNIQEKMIIVWYKPLYAELREDLESWTPSLTHIWTYYTKLYAKYPQLQTLPKKMYLDMIIKQLELYWTLDSTDQSAVEQVRDWLKKEVFKGHR